MKKKLYRSKQDRIIAGVCGGFGEYFDVDPTWIRIIWALSIFAGGTGAIAYIICWLIIPENPDQKTKKQYKGLTKTASKVEKDVKNKNYTVFGIILIILGTIFLFQNLFRWMSWRWVWPAAIIVIGVIMLLKQSD